MGELTSPEAPAPSAATEAGAPTAGTEAPTILEVLDRRGRPLQRLRVEHLPLTIGRDLASDVQLDDPYVCPVHARVVRDPDGRLVVEDLGSVNGLYAHSPARRVGRVALETTDTLRIGRTVLRVRHGAAPLARTLIDRAEPERAAGRPPLRVAICAVAVALVGANAYLGSYGPHASREVLSAATIVLVLAFAWGTAWSFVNRVLSHQWNLLGHLAVVCGFVIGLLVLDEIVAYLGFLVSSPRLVDGVEMAIAVPLLAALLSGHLRLCAPTPAVRRRLAALGVAALFVGLFEVMPRLINDGFNEDLHFGSALRPVPTSLLPTRSVDQFIGSLDSVQHQVDQLAKEAP